jgi:hypothetical protein
VCECVCERDRMRGGSSVTSQIKIKNNIRERKKIPWRKKAIQASIFLDDFVSICVQLVVKILFISNKKNERRELVGIVLFWTGNQLKKF